jgi:hypothetical protein
MKTTPRNPRTNEQNRKLYWLFSQLDIRDKDVIADIVGNFTNGRTVRTSRLDFLECADLIKWLDNTLKNKGKRETTSGRIENTSPESGEYKKLDRLRKGVIKAIFRWYELRGQEVTMDYVKATACRAAGSDGFNGISPARLTDIYHEFCRKQRTVETANGDDVNICMN